MNTGVKGSRDAVATIGDCIYYVQYRLAPLKQEEIYTVEELILEVEKELGIVLAEIKQTECYVSNTLVDQVWVDRCVRIATQIILSASAAYPAGGSNHI